MPLSYYPAPGEIVVCHFDPGAKPPEMVKSRPVIVAGPRLRRRSELVTIVPLSTTPPDPVEPYHCRIELAHPLPRPFDNPVMWAKCDMIMSVSVQRLDRFKRPRDGRTGARSWTTGRVDKLQLQQVRRAILHGLGLGGLTSWL